MNASLLPIPFLLIFGLGHTSREPVDPAKGVPIHSRLACDGFGAPEDDVHVRESFSPGGSPREFAVSRFHNEHCELDVKGKCLHKEKEGWRDFWTAPNSQPTGTSLLSIPTCYEWGSTSPIQVIVTGWYEDSSSKKPVWRQAAVKQVSTLPEVFEFTDPAGATARMQIDR